MIKFVFDNFKGMVLGSLTSVAIAIFWFAVDSKSTQATVEDHSTRINKLESSIYSMDGKLDTIIKYQMEEKQLRFKRK